MCLLEILRDGTCSHPWYDNFENGFDNLSLKLIRKYFANRSQLTLVGKAASERLPHNGTNFAISKYFTVNCRKIVSTREIVKS